MGESRSSLRDEDARLGKSCDETIVMVSQTLGNGICFHPIGRENGQELTSTLHAIRGMCRLAAIVMAFTADGTPLGEFCGKVERMVPVAEAASGRFVQTLVPSSLHWNRILEAGTP